MADQLNKSTRPRVATAAAGRSAAGAIRVPGAMRGMRGMRAMRAMRRMRAVPVIWIILAATLHGGCVPQQKERPPYAGPVLPLRQLVDGLNARNDQLPTLRGEGYFSAKLYDERGKYTSVDGDLTLLYRQSLDLRLVGKVLAQTVFDLGSNANRYWLVLPRDQTMWWGERAKLAGAGARRLPVRPDLVQQVLEVAPLASDFLREPVPVLQVDRAAYAYRLSWNVRLSDRWALRKQVWYDIQTLLPKRVELYDEHGQVVLSAELRDYAPLKGDFAGLAPQVAMEYKMAFPANGSTFRINLRELALKRKNVPNAGNFTFPAGRADVSKVIAVDDESDRSE